MTWLALFQVGCFVIEGSPFRGLRKLDVITYIIFKAEINDDRQISTWKYDLNCFVALTER